MSRSRWERLRDGQRLTRFRVTEKLALVVEGGTVYESYAMGEHLLQHLEVALGYSAVRILHSNAL